MSPDSLWALCLAPVREFACLLHCSAQTVIVAATGVGLSLTATMASVHHHLRPETRGP